MATYIVLGQFTNRGIRNVKDTMERADGVKELATKVGATVKEVYWTMGQYDVATLVDAPDDAVMTAFLLSVASLGNVRTQSLRAFSADEIGPIIGKMV